jgi:hypothetical protein
VILVIGADFVIGKNVDENGLSFGVAPVANEVRVGAANATEEV